MWGKGKTMKVKILLVSVANIILILLIVSILLVSSQDRTAPEIIFSSNDVLYIEGEDSGFLLEDAIAFDEVEGDVSHSLVIEGINKLSNGTQANVIYVARDSKNNIARVGRLIEYKDRAETNESSEQVILEDTRQEEEVVGQQELLDDSDRSERSDWEEQGITDEEGSSDETLEGQTEENENQTLEEEMNDHDEREDQATMSEIPVIKLKKDTVTIKKGESFNPLSWVEEAIDDKDDAWRRIRITGKYSVKKRGEYQLEYSITDTDGNISNVETLTLIVE